MITQDQQLPLHLGDEMRSHFNISPEQNSRLARFWNDYRDRGLIAGDTAKPLYEACPRSCRHSPPCWPPDLDDQRLPVDQAGIHLPWIGSRYEQNRIAVLAISLREYGGLLAQWKLYSDLAEKISPSG